MPMPNVVATSNSVSFLKFTFQGPSSSGVMAIPGLLANDVLLGFEGYTNPAPGNPGYFQIVGDAQLNAVAPYTLSGNIYVMIVLRWL